MLPVKPPFAQAHIKRARSALMGGGLLEPHDNRTQIRHPQPVRHQPPQHPFAMALAVKGFGGRIAFARHNQHQTRMIELALQRCGESTALAQDAFAVFYAARQQVDLYADCAQALVRLAGRFPMLALTNGNADVHLVGIGHLFVGSVGAHTVGLPKPHKAIFDAAASALQCSHEQVLHVGDDALLDVLAALDAGMQSVWVNRQGASWVHERKPHLAVPSLDVLCNALGV